MSLNQLIADNVDIKEIAYFLDNLSSDARLKEVLTLKKKDQVKLYEMAANQETIDLSFFVSEDKSALTEVIHSGINSLPAPRFIREFQKRFSRTADETASLIGYNHGATTSWIGPGYFVAKSTAGNAEWEKRGGVVIDYYDVPKGRVVESWPNVKPNSKGLQVLVYHQMRDYMRGVSKHVSIGVAYKKGKNMGNYFVLCRED